MTIWILVIAVAVAICLFAISKIRNPKILERGHIALSALPWLHVLFSIIVAFYVRIGFGSWPRVYLDNPDLPLLHGLLTSIVFGLIPIIFVLPPVWLGWLVIRLRRGVKRFWQLSAVLLITGIGAVIILLYTDPCGFWEWIFD